MARDEDLGETEHCFQVVRVLQQHAAIHGLGLIRMAHPDMQTGDPEPCLVIVRIGGREAPERVQRLHVLSSARELGRRRAIRQVRLLRGRSRGPREEAHEQDERKHFVFSD